MKATGRQSPAKKSEKKKKKEYKKESSFDEIIASAVIFCYCFRNVLSLSFPFLSL